MAKNNIMDKLVSSAKANSMANSAKNTKKNIKDYRQDDDVYIVPGNVDLEEGIEVGMKPIGKGYTPISFADGNIAERDLSGKLDRELFQNVPRGTLQNVEIPVVVGELVNGQVIPTQKKKLKVPQSGTKVDNQVKDNFLENYSKWLNEVGTNISEKEKRNEAIKQFFISLENIEEPKKDKKKVQDVITALDNPEDEATYEAIRQFFAFAEQEEKSNAEELLKNASEEDIALWMNEVAENTNRARRELQAEKDYEDYRNWMNKVADNVANEEDVYQSVRDFFAKIEKEERKQKEYDEHLEWMNRVAENATTEREVREAIINYMEQLNALDETEQDINNQEDSNENENQVSSQDEENGQNDLSSMPFAERLKLEQELMYEKIYGKTPMNVLMRNLNNDASRDATGVDTERLTLRGYVNFILAMRCLTGQNANSMISAEEVKKQNIQLAPYAQPFYDEKGNEYYDLSMVVNRNKLGSLVYEQNKALEDKELAKKLQNGKAKSKEDVVSICEDLAKVTGIKLNINTKANTFMPSRISSLKHAGSMLGRGKRFNSMSGTLYLNAENMTTTNILTAYVSRCATMSVNTNPKNFEAQLIKDRDFLALTPAQKQALLNDVKSNYAQIQYELHAICSDLIASEMVKMLPKLSSAERVTIQNSYLLSATQRINGLGDYVNNPYIMKFVSSVVTDSVSRFNSNYQFTANEIREINEELGLNKINETGNRFRAIYGEYAFRPEDLTYSTIRGKVKEAETTTEETAENDNESSNGTNETNGTNNEQENDTTSNNEQENDAPNPVDITSGETEAQEMSEWMSEVANNVQRRSRKMNAEREYNDYLSWMNAIGEQIATKEQENESIRNFFTAQAQADKREEQYQADLNWLNEVGNNIQKALKLKQQEEEYNNYSQWLNQVATNVSNEVEKYEAVQSFFALQEKSEQNEKMFKADLEWLNQVAKNVQEQESIYEAVRAYVQMLNKAESDGIKEERAFKEHIDWMNQVASNIADIEDRKTAMKKFFEMQEKSINDEKEYQAELKRLIQIGNNIQEKEATYEAVRAYFKQVEEMEKGVPQDDEPITPQDDDENSQEPIKPIVKSGKEVKPTKNNDCNSKPSGTFSRPNGILGSKSEKQIDDAVGKYIVKLMSKALSEKSLQDKRKLASIDEENNFAFGKAQKIAGSQATVESLFNNMNAKDNRTVETAKNIMKNSINSTSVLENIEGSCLVDLQWLVSYEKAAVITTLHYLQNKEDKTEDEQLLLDDWKKCKTTASFMNYYAKNIVGKLPTASSLVIKEDSNGKKSKYGIAVKNRTKQICRVASGQISILENLDKKSKEEFVKLSDGKFIVRNSKEDNNNLKNYKVYECVASGNNDAKIVENKIYSSVDLVNEYDSTSQEMQEKILSLIELDRKNQVKNPKSLQMSLDSYND